MKDIAQLQLHPVSEKIVEVLCSKTQSKNTHFFRILVAYHLTKLASMMRVNIITEDRGKIPINMYAINLSQSGTGKGYSTNIIEEQLTNQFKVGFFETTYPAITEQELSKLAIKRANIKGEDPDLEILKVEKEFRDAGVLPFAFDSGTTAAVKQMRHLLLMGGIGSMNLEIDEIGNNLLGNTDVLGTFLELFDMGKLKQKLTKNTKENTRNEEIDGKTPTNLLLFGTPGKLLNGSKTEEEFYSFLETGYARRALFGYTKGGVKGEALTADEIYDTLTDPKSNRYLDTLSSQFGLLSDVLHYNKNLIMNKNVSIIIIEYHLLCEERAQAYGEHEEIRIAEMEHRYFKATKLAGTYAFIDRNTHVTEDNIYAAIKLVEDSGKAFNQLLKRDRNYVKLAKYIASIQHEVTHVDLTEDLPFYRGSATLKHELLQLATAWGYKNQIIIKRTSNNGIEFFKGETLDTTDFEKIVLSYSNDIASGYVNAEVPYNKLHKLVMSPGLHWTNHHFVDGQRNDISAKAGFNLVVLDVDHGITLEAVNLLLSGFKYMTYTTKRHTDTDHRFRIILPLNYAIKLDSTDFKEFMQNIYSWLPFEVDVATGQRSRKWLTCDSGKYEYVNGDKLLDALLFIPKTAKNDEQKQVIQSYQSLSNLERWFIQNMDLGNRNNQLLKYALIMVDMGHDIGSIEQSVMELNAKVEPKLSTKEIQATILVTAEKKIFERGGNI